MFDALKWTLAVAAAAVFTMRETRTAAEDITFSFISDFLKHQAQAAPSAIVSALVCWNQGSARQLVRHLSERQIQTTLHVPRRGYLHRLLAAQTDRYVAFLLDLDCPGSIPLLEEANEMLAFRDRHRWLLLERSQKPPVKSKVSEREETTRHYVHDSLFKNTSAQDETDTAEPQSRQLLDVVLSQMNIFLDSDLTIGSRSSNTEFSLTEAYRRRSWGGLVKRKIAHWREGYGLELLAPRITAARRMNQHQELVKSAMVVTNNDTLNHLGDDVDRHIDSLTKANHVHLAHVLRILNASVEMKATDSWGYLQNGSWSGLAGYLQRGEVDIGCTAMFMLPSRLPIVHFISAPVKTKSAFLFRPPPLSFVQNIFTLPFSRAVWLSSVALLALMGALLYCNLKLEFRRGEHTLQSAAEPVKASWSDVVLLSFGVVCQQGAEVEARGVSGRTITFLLYISVIFLYTSYSACIVALLQSTTDSIQTLRDLYESGMEMGVLDIVYSHHFFSIASDPLRRSIYTKKINPPGGPSNFFSLEEGLAKVRKGLFAFHHELGPGYYIVSNTFLEEEKCGLHTVTYSQDFVSPWIAVTKNSPLKEIFAIAYRMLHESGLQIRESERFYQKKPDCSSAGSSFVSVGIADCYPALLVLGYGALCSLLAFLLERLVHNKFSGRVEFEATCWRAVERLPAFPRTKQSIMDVKPVLALCLLGGVWSDPTTHAFIGDALQFQAAVAPRTAVSAFVCWDSGSVRQLFLRLAERHFMLSVLQTTADILKQLNTTAASQHVTFVVDMHCEGARFLLQQANTLKLFDGWMRWLLLDNSCSNPFSARNTSFEVSKDFHSDDHNSAERITDSCVDGDSSSPEPDSTVSAYIEAALEHLDIHPASDVMVAKRISKGRFVLVETYKHAPHLKLVKAVVGEWSRDCGMLARASLVRFTRRVNMQGTLLRAGMVVTTNDSLLHLRDTVNRHIDTIQKVNYNLFYIVADMINASVDMKVLDTWGYNVNGSWDGLVGYLERGEVDIGASPLFVTKSRLLVLTYTFAATPAKFAFLFRQPPLSFVNNVFALPFSGSVWLASMALMVVMCVTLRFALRWEYCQRAFYPFNPDDPLSKYQRTVTWSDMMLLCAGSISEQGIEHEARAISGRIITILLLVAIIFLYTSYSACIVALLQSSTSSIRSLHDLVQSGLSLGAHDIIYNRYYFQEVNDPDPVRRAVCAKLTPQGGPDHFMTLEEGVGRVRKGQFAFHMELGMGYKIIWDTFLEAEKCNLQSIVYLIEIPYPHIAMSKKTPYKEVVRVSYRKLHEVGLQVRENLRFYHGKPKCENSGSNFMSVGIVDFYPALLVVTYGVLLSITVLMLEIFVHKRLSRFSGASCIEKIRRLNRKQEGVAQ